MWRRREDCANEVLRISKSSYRISHAQAFARLKAALSVKGMYCRLTALH